MSKASENRFMRVVVIYDLPMTTVRDGQEYRQFHKFLQKNGFIMQQFSFYSKLVLNQTQANATKLALRKALPAKGVVQCLTITEKQYAGIEYMTGKAQSKIEDSMDRWLQF